MSSPIEVTVAVAEGRPARDRRGAPNDRRDTALLSVDPSLGAGRSHVPVPGLCNECEAGTRSGWAPNENLSGEPHDRSAIETVVDTCLFVITT